MKITIPFSLIPPKILFRLSNIFMSPANNLAKFMPYLKLELNRADFKVDYRKYIAMCMTSSFFLLLFVGIVLTLLMSKYGKVIYAPIISLVFFFIIFFMQLNYPKVVANRRTRKLDADLLPALRALLLQLNSGVPLFEAIASVSQQEFGEISKEFREVIKNINSGIPQIEALEKLALRNPSLYFNRSIWQIINGMKEGAPIKEVLESIIVNLTKEQVIQIERYGSQLSPVAMFYMMGAVILPALGIVFFIVMASFIDLGESIIKIAFWGLLAFVVFFQFMFSGVVKSKRPSLLGE